MQFNLACSEGQVSQVPLFCIFHGLKVPTGISTYLMQSQITVTLTTFQRFRYTSRQEVFGLSFCCVCYFKISNQGIVKLQKYTCSQ